MKKFLFALTISFCVLFFVKTDSFAQYVEHTYTYDGWSWVLQGNVPDDSNIAFGYSYNGLPCYVTDGNSIDITYTKLFTPSGGTVSYRTTRYYFNNYTLCILVLNPVQNLPTDGWGLTSFNPDNFSFSQPEFDDSLDIFGFRVRKITGKLDLSNDGQTSLVSPWCMAWWDSVSDNVDHVVMTFYDTDTGDVVIDPATNYYSFLLGTYISGGAIKVGVTPYDSAGNYGYTSYAEVGYLFQSVDEPIGYTTDYTLDGEPVDVIGKDPQVVYKTTFVPSSGTPSGGTVIYEGDTYIYKTPPSSDPSPDNPNPIPPVPSTGAPTTPVPIGYKFDWPDASDKDKVFTGVKDFFTGFGDGFGSIVSLLLLIFPMLGPVGAVLIFCMGLVLVFGAIIILIKIIGTIL